MRKITTTTLKHHVLTRLTKKISFSFLLLFASCAPVQERSNLSQPMNKKMTAGIGDTIFSISKEKNLPNALGNADIFGRKTPSGVTTVQYIGIQKNIAYFKRKSIFIESWANTMNSTATVIQNSSTTTHSGIIGNNIYSGTSTTSLPPTIIPANTPEAKVLDQGELKIEVDLSKNNKSIFLEGYTINIINADSRSIEYIITR